MLLQPSLGTQEIDFRYYQENRPAKKKEKDSKITKSANTSFANAFSSKN